MTPIHASTIRTLLSVFDRTHPEDDVWGTDVEVLVILGLVVRCDKHGYPGCGGAIEITDNGRRMVKAILTHFNYAYCMMGLTP
jgi:hypothetical protein